MLEISVIVEATELVNAINNLAAALGGAKLPMPAAAQVAPTAPVQPAAPASAPAPAAPVAPAPAPAPAPASPVATVPVAQAPQYTAAQIMEAGAALMDMGKANDLIELLHSFGVQAVTELKPEQLGAFATKMRELGAKI